MRDFDPTASEFISSGYIARSQSGGALYDPGSIMSIAAPVVGGLISGNAAGDAADTQAAATDRANAMTQKQYDQTRTDLAPYRGSGSAANNKLMQLLGLTPGNGSSRSLDDITNDLVQNYGLALGSAGLSSAAQAAYDKQFGGSSGQGALLTPFTGADLQNEPGYQFGLNQGMTALDRSLQRGGMMFSGAALKGAQRFGQDYAGTKYGDAFNRDASQKQQTYNFLSGQSSAGQNAANMTSNAGTAMAGTIGANTTALGNAAGAAQIAQGNALSGGLTNAANGYQQNQLVNKILGGNSGFGGAQAAFSQTGLGSSGSGTGLAYGNQDYGQYF